MSKRRNWTKLSMGSRSCSCWTIYVSGNLSCAVSRLDALLSSLNLCLARR